MAEKTDVIYMDNAATTWPKPESVYRFMMDFYRTAGANPGRSGYEMSLEAGVLQDQHSASASPGFSAATKIRLSASALDITPPTR